MNHLSKAAFVAVIALTGAASAQTAAPLPDALKPGRIAGAGLNVTDLMTQKAWYETKLGMKVVGSFPPGTASPREYILSESGKDDGGAVLALLKSPNRPAGPNGFGRIIINAPDPKGLATFLAAQGVPMREVIPGSAYFITDPEGNAIELYNPLPPKAK
jgi:catechol-2,3-dioxygenase